MSKRVSRLKSPVLAAGVITACGLAAAGTWGAWKTPETAMIQGLGGWSVDPILTIGETACGYRPVGILDGLGAYQKDRNTIRVLANHELSPGDGNAYNLANGTYLTGARVSFFDIDRRTRSIVDAGLAYDTIYDRSGAVVTDPAQVNETGNEIDGLGRLCSAQFVGRSGAGFADDIFFTGEESGTPSHPHGGTEWALDTRRGQLWACPDLGRGAWENVTSLLVRDPSKIALLMGDDTAGAPLYLYVGTIDRTSPDFLTRNGLRGGQLHYWKADDGSLDPSAFNGTGTVKSGRFVPIDVLDAANAGNPGYDAVGYKNDATLQGEADAGLGFSFSRPEDVSTNPRRPWQAVFASTGRGGLYPDDDWGTVYTVDVDFSNLADITAELQIIYDGDDLGNGDLGVRNPDNLDWSSDGFIYVQEDRSTSLNTFGGLTGREASIWRLDPVTGGISRIAEMDRSSVVPAAIAVDGAPGDLGNWESSGVLDISKLFRARKGETILIADVQAHSITDVDNVLPFSPIRDEALKEGGQLILLTRRASPRR